MRIAHISDTHVRADGKPFKKTVDTHRALAVCMDHLAGLEPKPDAIIVSGDLAQTATPDDYQMLKGALDGREPPAYVIPGNMDDRGAVRAVFAEAPDRPTLLFLHHPPVEPGSDEPAYEGAEDLGRIVAANPQVVRIACGHLHERNERSWANTVVSIAASVAVSRIGLAATAAMDPDACPVYSL